MVMTVNFLVMSTALDQETRVIMLVAVAYGGVIQAILVYYVTNVSLSALRVDSKHSQIWYSVLLVFFYFTKSLLIDQRRLFIGQAC